MSAANVTTHEDFDSFHEAEHDEALVIRDGRGDPWLAFQTEDGDWYAVRPRHEDDEPYSEHDPWRPVGLVEVESLRYPLHVVPVVSVLAHDVADRERQIKEQAWDEGYLAGDPHHRRGDPAAAPNPYRIARNSEASP